MNSSGAFIFREKKLVYLFLVITAYYLLQKSWSYSPTHIRCVRFASQLDYFVRKIRRLKHEKIFHVKETMDIDDIGDR